MLLDAIAVLVFAAVGRQAHEEASGLVGVLDVAWPFLTGAAIGWAVGRGWRRPLAPVPTGVAVWVGAWAAGMMLRQLSGDGTAPAFLLVAAISLAVVILGWRVIATLVLRARR